MGLELPLTLLARADEMIGQASNRLLQSKFTTTGGPLRVESDRMKPSPTAQTVICLVTLNCRVPSLGHAHISVALREYSVNRQVLLRLAERCAYVPQSRSSMQTSKQVLLVVVTVTILVVISAAATFTATSIAGQENACARSAHPRARVRSMVSPSALAVLRARECKMAFSISFP